MNPIVTMPEDKTTLVLNTLQRLETKADTAEARHVEMIRAMGSMGSDIAMLKARLDAKDEADKERLARQSEDRGGTRAWVGTVVSAIFSIIAVFISFTHRK